MEDNIEKAVVEVVTKSGTQIYKDLAQPLLSGVGKTLGLIPASINAALSPLQIWIEQKTFNVEETKQRLAEKLKNINPENIVSPAGYVAIPALQAIAYCADSEVLRDMYANLLAASMLKGINKEVHPSYVEIIKQINPDEAKLLKYIANDDCNGSYPLIDIRKVNKEDNTFVELVVNFTNIGENICEFPYSGVQKYIVNLKRLGLIDIPFGVKLSDEHRYETLEKHKQILEFQKNKLPEGWQYEIFKKQFELTAYGRQFIKVCVTNI